MKKEFDIQRRISATMNHIDLGVDFKDFNNEVNLVGNEQLLGALKALEWVING